MQNFTIQDLDPRRYFRYEVKTMDSGGGLHEIDIQPMDRNPTIKFLSCGGAIAIRGLIIEGGDFGIWECLDYCWPDHVMWNFDYWEGEGDPPPEFGLYNFYGEYFFNTMVPMELVLKISRMELVTDPTGCGALEVETRTWGGLKALYR